MKLSALALGFIVSWNCAMHEAGVSVYRIDHRLAGGNEWHQCAWTNELQDTVPALSGEVNLYRITHIKGAEASAPSNVQCGLVVRWCDGICKRDSAYTDSAMAYVELPASRWACEYAFNDSIPTGIVCRSLFDYDHNGRVNLSDFVAFAKTQWTLKDFADFGTVYNSSGRFEW